jgi:hypothetical protein
MQLYFFLNRRLEIFTRKDDLKPDVLKPNILKRDVL